MSHLYTVRDMKLALDAMGYTDPSSNKQAQPAQPITGSPQSQEDSAEPFNTDHGKSHSAMTYATGSSRRRTRGAQQDYEDYYSDYEYDEPVRPSRQARETVQPAASPTRTRFSRGRLSDMSVADDYDYSDYGEAPQPVIRRHRRHRTRHAMETLPQRHKRRLERHRRYLDEDTAVRRILPKTTYGTASPSATPAGSKMFSGLQPMQGQKVISTSDRIMSVRPLDQ